VRFAGDLLARWPGHTVREILSEAKRRDAKWSARVNDVISRDFERDEFRARVRQQVKELDSTSRVLCARIRRRHMRGGV